MDTHDIMLMELNMETAQVYRQDISMIDFKSMPMINQVYGSMGRTYPDVSPFDALEYALGDKNMSPYILLIEGDVIGMFYFYVNHKLNEAYATIRTLKDYAPKKMHILLYCIERILSIEYVDNMFDMNDLRITTIGNNMLITLPERSDKPC